MCHPYSSCTMREQLKETNFRRHYTSLCTGRSRTTWTSTETRMRSTNTASLWAQSTTAGQRSLSSQSSRQSRTGRGRTACPSAAATLARARAQGAADPALPPPGTHWAHTLTRISDRWRERGGGSLRREMKRRRWGCLCTGRERSKRAPLAVRVLPSTAQGPASSTPSPGARCRLISWPIESKFLKVICQPLQSYMYSAEVISYWWPSQAMMCWPTWTWAYVRWVTHGLWDRSSIVWATKFRSQLRTLFNCLVLRL